MAFGHHEHVVENFSKTTVIFPTKENRRSTCHAGSSNMRVSYFVASPPSVTLIPLRKLNGNAGKPGAGS